MTIKKMRPGKEAAFTGDVAKLAIRVEPVQIRHMNLAQFRPFIKPMPLMNQQKKLLRR